MPKSPDYCCIRCGYSTMYKSNMWKHFYGRSKSCCAIENDIELTEEIKQHILNNRIYKIPQDDTKKVINNFNTINNFVANADLFKKLTHVLDYQDKTLIGYGDQIEEHNATRIKRLESNSYKYGFKLERDDITDMIDRSTTLDKDNIEKFNVYYSKFGKIALYHDDEWEELREEKGIQQIIRINQTCFLETYEIYILKRLYQDDHLPAQTRNRYREQLKDYYKYLVTFDLMPFANGKENEEIVDSGPYYNIENTSYIEEQAMVVYNEAKKEQKKSEINKCKKTVTDIIKRNSQANLKQLNEALIGFINMDQQFKDLVLAEIANKVV